MTTTNLPLTETLDPPNFKSILESNKRYEEFGNLQMWQIFSCIIGGFIIIVILIYTILRIYDIRKELEVDAREEVEDEFKKKAQMAKLDDDDSMITVATIRIPKSGKKKNQEIVLSVHNLGMNFSLGK
jgi:hypothetical protein